MPASFRTAYPKLFPLIHRRVYLNLKDKSMAPDALREVLVDFLVRWGDSFEKLEPHHVTFLNEICDRTCAKLNGQQPQDFRPIEDSERDVPNVVRSRLGDDVIKRVEQDLYTLFLASAR